MSKGFLLKNSHFEKKKIILIMCLRNTELRIDRKHSSIHKIIIILFYMKVNYKIKLKVLLTVRGGGTKWLLCLKQVN